MARGRKPKPIEQHVADGTYRPDRHGDGEAVYLDGEPRRPANLTPQAEHAWETIVTDLGQRATAIDSSVIELAAVMWGRAQEAREIVNNRLMLRGTNDQLKINPAWRVERDAWAAFLSAAEQIGLTAVGRARLGLAATFIRSMEQEMAETIGPSPRARRRYDLDA